MPAEKWFEEMRQRYTSGEASVFVLHGNVNDRIICEDKWYSLSDYLKKMFQATKTAILTYNLSTGLHFTKDTALITDPFYQKLEKENEYGGEHNAEASLSAMETILVSSAKVAVIIEYAETVAPAGDITTQMSTDREAVVTLHRWSQLTNLVDNDNIVVLISETLSELSQKIVSNPKIAIIEIPMPDMTSRQKAVGMVCKGMDESLVAHYAEITSGLKCVQITGILNGVRTTRLFESNGEDAAEQLIHKRKQEIIKHECFGLLEIVQPKFGFEAVGGLEEVKKILLSVAKNMQEGNCKRVPMGILVVGAQGTGKTWLIKAFAKECGATMAVIRNFRGQYVGLTEANQERIIKVAKAIENLILVFDEADRTVGNDEDGNSDPTSSRTKARWKEFMSDTSNRGKILFVMMTNRPDLIDLDLKRAGRIDVKIPLFYAQTAAEVADIFNAVIHESGTEITFPMDMVFQTTVLEKIIGYSNADIAEINRVAVNLAEERGHPLDLSSYIAAIKDYMPTRDTETIEFMELLAAFEASSRRLLPDKYAKMSADTLTERLHRHQRNRGNRR